MPGVRYPVRMIASLLAPVLLLAVQPPAPRLLPPPGTAVSEVDRAELQAGLARLGRLAGRLKSHDLWADVEIFRKAVDWSLREGTIYGPGQVAAARRLLEEGTSRALALLRGDAPWTRQTGLVARGYVSKLDGSVQPYGLVVPTDAFDARAHRLDLFFHGRGEQLTELAFLADRMRNPGEFVPAGAFVLHPYGRFCNANRLAGEVDVFEAMDDVRKRYKIDDDRIVARGFSMGGNSCWHLATQHADLWAAAAPGAGFSETREFLRLKTLPPLYQQTLWHLYDATDYAVNLAQLPTVAYSGERDGQKQAADRMAEAMQAEGLTLPHVIGANAGHFYTADGKAEINRFVDAAVAKGRNRFPKTLRFTTFTLRWSRLFWLTVEGLEKHWERARVEGTQESGAITLATKNVAALSLHLPQRPAAVTIDGQALGAGDRFVRGADGRWRQESRPGRGLAKRPGLQGPIDDAFFERFVFVRPTGKALTPALEAWTKAAMEQAIADWRRYFRGDVLIVEDTALTAEEIRRSNLVLWGDPKSNAVLARIARKLPLRFDPASGAVPVLIYPNPLQPDRYVVVNSGFTWGAFGSDNNAQQCPKLPDWAVRSLADGQVLDAGFFDERWRRVAP